MATPAIPIDHMREEGEKQGQGAYGVGLHPAQHMEKRRGAVRVQFAVVLRDWRKTTLSLLFVEAGAFVSRLRR